MTPFFTIANKCQLYMWFIMIIDAECRYIFWRSMFFNNTFILLLHGASTTFFFWTPFLFFFLRPFSLPSPFLSLFWPLNFSHLLTNLFPNFWLLLFFFECCEWWLLWISKFYVPHTSGITTNGVLRTLSSNLDVWQVLNTPLKPLFLFALQIYYFIYP